MKRISQAFPLILSGALISEALRIWTDRGAGAEVLQAATLLPLAALLRWLLTKQPWVRPTLGKPARIAGHLFALALLILGPRWSSGVWLMIPICAWALELGRDRWNVVLPAVTVCWLTFHLTGSPWPGIAVAIIAAGLTVVSEQGFPSPDVPDSLADPEPLWLPVVRGAHRTLIVFAAFHVLQVLSPVAHATEVALLCAASVALFLSHVKKIKFSLLDRIVLFGFAWISLPGLLDRNLYPLYTSSIIWPLGWCLTLLPWGATLGTAGKGAFSWLGVAVVSLAAIWDGRVVTEPSILAGLLLLLTGAEHLHLNRAKFFNGSLKAAFALAVLIVIAMTQSYRLSAGPEESVLETAQSIGRTLAVVQPLNDSHVQLRDRFHQRTLSSESNTELRRQGLLPFRLHSGGLLTRLLVIGATNPAAVSAALELPWVTRLSWVEQDPRLFAVSRWWISPEAAQNTKTRTEKVIARPLRFLKEFNTDSWDAIVLSAATPWSKEGAEYFAPELPALISDQLFADGIAIQWIQMQQWDEPALFELLRRWNEAFEGRVELWRGDLSPYSPYLAIVARGVSAPLPVTQIQPDQKTFSALPDRLVGAPGTTLSLRLADQKGLQEILGRESDRRVALENPWRNAGVRGRPNDLLGPQWLIQRLTASSTRLGGPAEGGLRYTRAALLRLTSESDWGKEYSKAKELLEFDPGEDLYPDLFPKNGR